MKIKQITPPQNEPVDLNTDVKPQLRIDPSDTSLDETLSPLITAAREWCEGFQNRAYVTQTFELALDGWPCGNTIKLPRPPLQTVNSVQYIDDKGIVATWDPENYVVDDFAEPARLVKVHGVSWPPINLTAANGIRIRYTAGYGDAADVPKKIKQAIILLVNVWFESPGCDPPQSIKSLLWQDRVVPI
ncbi:hypothetical protein [Paenibacillus sp. Pae108]|uniref:head-tail connector protein n=1 Tax=Paenibacillus sp. Pae108 TaxID=2926019 RepID=UPI0021198E2A|nr:hypothetical protein [Paenibacillus sp. Pae108]